MLHYYILRKTARLIGNSVRRRKQIAKPNSTVSVDSQGVGSGDSLCALRVGAYNEIEKTSVFSSIPSLESKVNPHQGKSLRKLKSSKVEKMASLFLILLDKKREKLYNIN